MIMPNPSDLLNSGVHALLGYGAKSVTYLVMSVGTAVTNTRRWTASTPDWMEFWRLDEFAKRHRKLHMIITLPYRYQQSSYFKYQSERANYDYR